MNVRLSLAIVTDTWRTSLSVRKLTVSSANTNSTPSVRRIAFAIFVVLASLITPIAIVTGYSLLHHHRRTVAGCVFAFSYESVIPIKDNEVWFPFIRRTGIGSGWKFESEIKRMDLATGQVQDTGLKVVNEVPRVHWADGQLYLWTETAVYQRQDSTLKKIGAVPPPFGSLHTSPFVYDGRVTMVIESADSRFWLNHLVDGNWSKGREILLPVEVAPGTVASITSPFRASAIPGQPRRLSVIQQGTLTHLFLRDVGWNSVTPYFAVYRSNFEFADAQDDVPSALAPQNVWRSGTGWEPVQIASANNFFYAMTCDRDGCLFTSFSAGMRGSQNQIVRRQLDGRWDILSGLKSVPDKNTGRLAIAGTAGQSYLFQANNSAWGSFDAYPIEGNTVQSEQSLLPPHEFADMWRKIEFYGVLLIAALSYPGVLILGMSVCVRRHPWHRFGLQQARLASPLRRSLAWLLDWTFIGSLCLLSLGLHLKIMGTDPIPTAAIQEQLIQIQHEIEIDLLNILFVPVNIWRASGLQDSLENNFLFMLFLAMGVDTLFILWCFKVYSESRHRTTLGKWLFGIQTVQTTLRPCQIKNAVVRDVLWCVDFLLCITFIPAAISVMLSNSGQRLGDRAADTIVIRRSTIQDLPTLANPT